ncbi:DUF4347 domain-containing protein [Kovacikia minuta CCNUW1]|uniref:DUF7925 domain-containing protein n=1 Tax=Kovacikia minuta TaxID=2931930 RepID=UPI001CCFF0C5|nr:DUF4347 domain-containing protein [Kovacikia minuta]UBF28134.1 DUF4347 domain-containing protein [Kovacikia minuta CCNUW1]
MQPFQPLNSTHSSSLIPHPSSLFPPSPLPTPSLISPAPFPSSSSLLFIDPTVDDLPNLLSGVTAGTEVHILNSSQDAVSQITNTLLGREGISSIHIVSHGEAGGLDFGTGKLDLSDLPNFASQIQSWKKALTNDADILLYGCDVAEGELGRAFVSILSQLTGAEVAASTNLTGNSAKGGDWALEFHTGSIEAGLAFTNPYSYSGTLAGVTVTNTLDVTNGDVSSIPALNASDGGDGISLREAVQAANNTAGADTITFGGPTFTDATPDTITLIDGVLAISDDLTIQGTGASNLVVTGDGSVGLLRVDIGGTASFNGLTVSGGRYGINNSGTITSLSNSTFSNNLTYGIVNAGTINNLSNSSFSNNGVGIFNPGTITSLSNSSFSNNRQQGINNIGTITSLNNSTISNNQDSGISNAGTITSLSNSTISNNGNSGIFNDNNGSIGLSTITISNNGQGIYNNAGTISLSNSTISSNQFGGISNNGTISLSNSTIAGNLSYGVDSTEFGTGSIQNSLLVGNGESGTSNFSGIIQLDASSLTGTFAALGVDPTLRDNGGQTQTHALLPGSAAINAATNGTSTDQRGIAAVGTRDIGAFESRGFSVTSVSGNNQTANSGAAFTNPLVVSVSSAFNEPVNGGVITFAAPSTAASTNPATNTATITGGQASASVTANSTGGSYSVSAGSKGIATPVSFSLTNGGIILGVLNGPNGTPDAVGPTDNNDDFTNQSSNVLTQLTPGTTFDPNLVSFNNTVRNTGGATADISLLPTPPTNINDLPAGAIVTLSANQGATSATYQYTGTAFVFTSGTGIVGGNPVSATNPVRIDAVAANGTANYTVNVDLPLGTPLSTDPNIQRGFPVTITAFIDTNGNGLADDAATNRTIDRVYTGFLQLTTQSRVIQGNGPAVQGSDGTLSTTPKTPAPGNAIEYVVQYRNISESQPASGNGNVILNAGNVVIVEDGTVLPSNWARDNTFDNTIDTSHVLGSVQGAGTIQYFSGDPATHVLGAEQTGTTASSDVTRYVNSLTNSIAPGAAGTFIFQREVNLGSAAQVINNEAAATYEDLNHPSDPNNSVDPRRVNGTSNQASASIAEVAGISVIAGTPEDSNGGILAAEDLVYFPFTITNIGNDLTRFQLPTQAGITGPGTVGTLQYSTDNGASWDDIPPGGLTTTAITVNGTVKVRVPVTINSGATPGQQIQVTLGETNPVATGQNSPRAGSVNDARDVYTVDNPDGSPGEVVGVPANGVVEGSASASVTLDSRYYSLAKILTTRTGYTDNGTSGDITDDTISYTLGLQVESNDVTGQAITPSALAGSSVPGLPGNNILVSDAIPFGTELATAPTAPTGWQVVYSTTSPSTSANAATWTTTPPPLSTVTRIGFVKPTIDGNSSTYLLVGSSTSFAIQVKVKAGETSPLTIANMAQVFGKTPETNAPVLDESGDQNPSNFDGPPGNLTPPPNTDTNGDAIPDQLPPTVSDGYIANSTDLATTGTDTTGNNTGDTNNPGANGGGEANVFELTATAPPTVTLSTTTPTLTEGGSNGTITITLSEPSANPIDVNFSLMGSAGRGTDYTITPGTGISNFNPVAGTFRINANTTSVTFTIQTTDDIAAEADETIALTLTVTTGGYQISNTPLNLTISRNDFVVTSTADSGEGSLRQAIANANSLNGTDTITFGGSTFTDATPDTISLASGQLSITDSVTITGTGADKLTLSQNGSEAARIFNVGSNATVTLEKMTIANGNAINANGGGILNSGNLTIANSALHNNSATRGAGIYNNGGTLSITNSTLDGNTASENGGGIANVSGTLTIRNSTISGNQVTGTTYGGGAIDQYGSGNPTATIENSTIAFNSAANASTSGIWLENGTLSLRNTIVANNNGTNNFQVETGATLTSLGNNLTNSVTSPLNQLSDRTNANARLAPLANNGGTTQTHALLSGSAAINAGNNANAPTTDQRGFTRILSDKIDIGAVEYAPQPDYTSDGKIDLLWRNSSSGANVIWALNGTSYSTAFALPTLTDTNWQLEGTADFTGDGKADLLWRNRSTGANVVWQLNGHRVQHRLRPAHPQRHQLANRRHC